MIHIDFDRLEEIVPFTKSNSILPLEIDSRKIILRMLEEEIKKKNKVHKDVQYSLIYNRRYNHSMQIFDKHFNNLKYIPLNEMQ